jgi:hypothetical protein
VPDLSPLIFRGRVHYAWDVTWARLTLRKNCLGDPPTLDRQLSGRLTLNLPISYGAGDETYEVTRSRSPPMGAQIQCSVHLGR